MKTASATKRTSSAPVSSLFPERARLADTATAVARAVAAVAIAEGVAPHLSDEEINAAVEATRWQAAYRPR